MRIISGTARGRKLKCPRGNKARPTPDRVREAMFSILGERVKQAGVLDLFAGTGSLGLEALSRGAQNAVFVEKDPVVAKYLKNNVSTCGFEDRARVVKAPVRPYLRSNDLSNFDLIFADPPYVSDEGSLTLLALSKHAKSLQDSLVILEHSSLNEMDAVPESLFVIDRRRYGDISILMMGFKS